MHSNFDQIENFEAFLASEFDTSPKASARLGEDYYDVGYRVVNRLAEDLTLDFSILDFENLD